MTVMEVNGSREANNNEEIDEEEDLDLDDKSVEKFLEIFTLQQLRALVKLAVWKDPVVAENFRHLVDVESGHRQVILNNLTEDQTAEILTSFFGKYGEIEECICLGRGRGFVMFMHGSDARKALKQPLKKIGNRAVVCESTSSIGPVVSHLYQYRNAKNNNIGLEGRNKNFEELHKNVVVKLPGPIPVAYGNQTAMIYGIQPGVEKGYHNTQMGQGGH